MSQLPAARRSAWAKTKAVYATIVVCPTNRDALAAKPTREAAAEQLFELADMLLDDAR